MERLVLVRCPELLVEDEGGAGLRRFTRVVDAVQTYSPWVTVVRAGVCTLPARGPSRFFGGVEAVVRLVRSAVGAVDGGTSVEVGVAEGVFAAHLAAQRQTVVPAEGTAAFLAPWPVDVLQDPDLAQLLTRLGLPTLGDFAALPERHVLARLGGAGVVRHRLARAVAGELPGFRQPAVAARMARLAAAGPSAGAGIGAPTAQVAAGGRDRTQQVGFWGGRRHADDRAARALATVQHLVGPEGVQVIRCQGGRSPADRARFASWTGFAGTPLDEPVPGSPTATPGSPTATPGSAVPGPAIVRRAGAKAVTPPWPGRIPPPAPSVVLRQPVPVALVNDVGAPLRVTSRGALTDRPRRLQIDTRPWTAVDTWAGPWPTWERWWAPADQHREARLQVVTADHLAHLVAARSDGWWLLATYD